MTLRQTDRHFALVFSFQNKNKNTKTLIDRIGVSCAVFPNDIICTTMQVNYPLLPLDSVPNLVVCVCVCVSVCVCVRVCVSVGAT